MAGKCSARRCTAHAERPWRGAPASHTAAARRGRRLAERRRRVAEAEPGGEPRRPFLYVYELPAELNVDRQALPTAWHDQQYDCAAPPVTRAAPRRLRLVLSLAAAARRARCTRLLPPAAAHTSSKSSFAFSFVAPVPTLP